MKESVYGQGLSHDQFFNTRVVQGMVYGTATTACVQATGTGAFHYHVNLHAMGTGSPAGIILVDGVASQIAAAADINLGSGTTGNAILANGQSIIYAIYYYRSIADNVIRQGIYTGTVALTAAVVAPTNAQIEATLAVGTVYLRTLDMTINRTGDVDTMTFVYDHTVRNLQHPATVQNA
ncbi:hypothetical protein M0R72_07900 [Candidatus Pacearchaeota archaeon]|jgi:hypothetical protein|nr:hypothetical protein [Candidatus Pacearchaeota archaeon]